MSVAKGYQFQDAGTLLKPGWIGRLVRLAMAVICLYAACQVFRNYEEFVFNVPREAILWFLVMMAFFLLPPVVNIGFGKILHSKTQSWFLMLFFFSVYYGNLVEQSYYGTISGYLLFLLPLYVFSHLGISFLIASIIRTPGCEMRAIPHLWMILSGRNGKEHYCPGFIDAVDKWEAGRNTNQKEG